MVARRKMRPVMNLSDLLLALVAATAAAFCMAAGLSPVAGFLIVGAAAIAVGPLRRRAELPAPAVTAPALAGRLERQFLENLPAALLIIGAGGRVSYANAAAQSLLPHLREGEHFAHLIRAPAFVEAVGATLADGEERSLRFTAFHGAERYYDVRVARLPAVEGIGAAGEFQAIVWIEDRTQAHRAEELRADFVANASHELRTPLASVIGYIETLQNHARDDPEARERFLGIMAREAARMQRLVDDLMSLSRIEQDEHVRPDEIRSLNRIATESASALAPVAARKGAVLEIALPPTGADVSCDPDQLAQVFSNLIDNALKYGGEGGVVRIDSPPPSKAHPNRYGVRVSDNGPGIPREHVHRLTERFYRVGAKGRPARSGNGLGLAIAKHILNRHRGRLEIVSTLGEGSAFTVWLPRAEGVEEAEDPAPVQVQTEIQAAR